MAQARHQLMDEVTQVFPQEGLGFGFATHRHWPLAAPSLSHPAHTPAGCANSPWQPSLHRRCDPWANGLTALEAQAEPVELKPLFNTAASGQASAVPGADPNGA